MNFYERIQKSLDLIEDNLTNRIDIDLLAKEAFMSVSNFYRLFLSIVGYNVKEYIRLRRISMAAYDISCNKELVTEIAYKYVYTSIDSFTRTFKRIVGILPKDYKKGNNYFEFRKIDIMKKYFFEGEDKMNEYPEIKVIKNFQRTKVIYFNYFGKEPEEHAFELLSNFLQEEGINIIDMGLRVFGYNNPSPITLDEAYGYEVCLTIPEDMKFKKPLENIKYLESGLYAIQNISRRDGEEIGYEIMRAWERLNKWIVGSKYVLSDNVWLEEHLGFDDNNDHIGGMDLYMPIQNK